MNVQPYSGSPANLAVYLAFLKPGETVMGLGLPAGGHLTHGHSVSITGKFFKSVPYGVRKERPPHRLDQVRALAREHRPKLLWCGTTAYPRTLDFAAFRAIADEVGAILAADIAHLAGLVVGGAHPSPIGIADVVTSTTHKTLPRPARRHDPLQEAARLGHRPRGLPGLQGGPHNHTTAAIAVAAHEAAQPSFKTYAHAIVENAKAARRGARARGFGLVTGGTDNHLLLLDLTQKGVAGKVYAQALDRAGIVANYNAVPFDPRKPFDPSGLRLGTPAVTSRGMGKDVMPKNRHVDERVVKAPADEGLVAAVAREVKELCRAYPAPGIKV